MTVKIFMHDAAVDEGDGAGEYGDYLDNMGTNMCLKINKCEEPDCY